MTETAELIGCGLGRTASVGRRLQRAPQPNKGNGAMDRYSHIVGSATDEYWTGSDGSEKMPLLMGAGDSSYCAGSGALRRNGMGVSKRRKMRERERQPIVLKMESNAQVHRSLFPVKRKASNVERDALFMSGLRMRDL